MTCKRIGNGIITYTEDYKPGDLPPPRSAGYLKWHAWADVQRKAKIKQKPCRECGKWLTPQERDLHAATHFTEGVRLDAVLQIGI